VERSALALATCFAKCAFTAFRYQRPAIATIIMRIVDASMVV